MIRNPIFHVFLFTPRKYRVGDNADVSVFLMALMALSEIHFEVISLSLSACRLPAMIATARFNSCSVITFACAIAQIPVSISEILHSRDSDGQPEIAGEGGNSASTRNVTLSAVRLGIVGSSYPADPAQRHRANDLKWLQRNPID